MYPITLVVGISGGGTFLCVPGGLMICCQVGWSCEGMASMVGVWGMAGILGYLCMGCMKGGRQRSVCGCNFWC